MKNKKTYISSFIIPIILMVIVYALKGIYPFGNNTLLTIDMKGQYISFYSYLIDSNNLLYTFTKALGGNMYGIFTYYLSSPLNIVLFLFNKINLTEGILVLSLLKFGLCGLTSSIFFSKVFKKNDISVIIFSISYALMSYNVVYIQNLMWIDGAILLPLIFLGIEKKNYTLFYITLSIAIISNFYMGYMIVIGSFIYYLYVFTRDNNYIFDVKKNYKKILSFISYILMSVITTMFILLPTAFALLAGKSDMKIENFKANPLISAFDLIPQFFVGTFREKQIEFGAPNIFVGVLAFILIILYFVNSKINIKEKKLTAILLSVFVISFVVIPINLIWHMLQPPIWFPFRYSFILAFILLIIAYTSYINLKDVTEKQFMYVTLGVILLSLFIDFIKYNNQVYYIYLGSCALMVTYLYLLKRNIELNKLILFLVCIELITNSLIIVAQFKYTPKNKYTNFVSTVDSITDEIEKNDNSFYRIEKDFNYNVNDAMTFNFKGVSHFSSVFESDTSKLLGNELGLLKRFYTLNYNGRTLVTDYIFNVKYMISKKGMDYYNKIGSYDDITTYQNPYSTGLGILVDPDITNLKLEKFEPFINQNNILKSMTNTNNDVFSMNNINKLELINLTQSIKKKQLYYKKVNTFADSYIDITINVEKDRKLYYYMSSKLENKVDVLLNDNSLIDQKDKNNYSYNVLELGNYKKGDVVNIKIKLLENTLYLEDFMFYTFDFDTFEDAVKTTGNIFNVTENKTTYVKGTVKVTDDRNMLYTSIPYEKGWKVYVNGTLVKKEKIVSNLIGVRLDKGDNIVEFKYTTRGLIPGIILSILGIFIFCISLKYKNKKHA